MPPVINLLVHLCHALGRLPALRRAPVQAALGRQLQQCGLRALPGIVSPGRRAGLGGGAANAPCVRRQCGLHPAHLLQLLLSELAPLLTALFCLPVPARDCRRGGGAAHAWRVAHACRHTVDPLSLCAPRLWPSRWPARLLTLYLLLIAQARRCCTRWTRQTRPFCNMLEPLTPAMALLCLSKSLLFGALTAASSCLALWRPKATGQRCRGRRRARCCLACWRFCRRRAVCPAAGAVE